MKYERVWSEEYGCYVSTTFAPRKEKVIKLDITNCVIKITIFGFYYLWLNGKRIKKLNFDEFLLYKGYVKKIIEDDAYGII